MFIFALVANATYVGSILVRTTEWENIKPNLPWLLDAIVCVVLDLFVSFLHVYTISKWKMNYHILVKFYFATLIQKIKTDNTAVYLLQVLQDAELRKERRRRLWRLCGSKQNFCFVNHYLLYNDHLIFFWPYPYVLISECM